MIYFTAWTDPFLRKFTHPHEHILTVSLFLVHFRDAAMTSELPLTKIIQATNFYSKIWGRILIFRRLLGPVPYIYIFYNHWWFSLLGTDHSPSGTKQCNEVWIVVYMYIYFLAYILWFFKNCFFTLSFWMVRLVNISCHNTDINIWQIYTLQKWALV